MPRKIFQKYIPTPEQLKQQKSLRFLGERLYDPNLWHLNRRSVSLAFAVGLFVMWVPLPGQMMIAAATVFYVRANLPIAVALVWITNPLTMPPMFYFAYLVGLWSLGQGLPSSDFEFNVENITTELTGIGGPFLFGCLILGVVCAVVGYFFIRLLWTYSVARRWKARNK